MLDGGGDPDRGIACLMCGGGEGTPADCQGCGGRGFELVTQCPRTLITPDIWEAMEAAYFADKGVYPESGGVNDQTAHCLTAFRLIWNEEAKAKAELEAPNV